MSRLLGHWVKKRDSLTNKVVVFLKGFKARRIWSGVLLLALSPVVAQAEDSSPQLLVRSTATSAEGLIMAWALDHTATALQIALDPTSDRSENLPLIRVDVHDSGLGCEVSIRPVVVQGNGEDDIRAFGCHEGRFPDVLLATMDEILHMTTALRFPNSYARSGNWRETWQLLIPSVRVHRVLEVYDAETLDRLLAETDPTDIHRLNRLAIGYQRLGDYPQARDLYLSALESARRQQERLWLVLSYANLATIYDATGQASASQDAYEELEMMFRGVTSGRGHAVLANNVANLYIRRGQLDHAQSLLERSASIFRTEGEWLGLGRTYQNLAGIHHRRGDLSVAMQYWVQALVNRVVANDRNGMASSLTGLGLYLASRAERTSAREMFRHALSIRRITLHREGEAWALHYLAWLDALERNFGRAVQRNETALALRREIQDVYGMAYSESALADIYTARGEYSRAINFYTAARSRFRRLSAPEADTLDTQIQRVQQMQVRGR